ncbi:hypothetical protein [Roseovarius nanhaiticus]|uniref:hypothetical protein n=1 Tax=Roseovarius nanhaiticus TaxID=573024 RepID=UPI00249257CE|nr:hypothetical protein [Roseovarius nanhaiticus]
MEHRAGHAIDGGGTVTSGTANGPSRRAVLAGLMAAPLMPRFAQAQEAGRAGVSFNLAPINDWSSQQPFIDVFKTGRRWIGHLPGQWGGRNYTSLAEAGLLDANGWPTRIPGDLGSIGTVLMTDLPEEAEALAGRYVLRFDGDGIVEVSGRARNVRYGGNEVSFDFAPGPGPVDIRIQRSDRQGSGDYVRNIRVMRIDLEDLHERGALFRPDWIDTLRGARTLRFMDWMNTNNAGSAAWEARAQAGDFSYTRAGAPIEVMMALCAALEAEPWLCVPHLAEDSYARQMAQAVRAALPDGRRVHVEFSNEVWNWQFAQTEWADAQARALWGVADRGAQFYGLRAAEVARIFSEVFAEDRARLVNVIATQTGWLGLEADILTAPLAVADGWDAPAAAFDAYAVTGYFGHVLGSDKRRGLVAAWLEQSRAAAEADGRAAGLMGDGLDDYVTRHRYDLASRLAAAELRSGAETGDSQDTLADMIQRIWPYHAEVAQRHGLALTMYEGGSHVVGLGLQVDDAALTEFLVHFNYTAEMGALYADLMDGWSALKAGPFNQFNDLSAPGKWGSWGAMRWPGDRNPRWRAIEARK